MLQFLTSHERPIISLIVFKTCWHHVRYSNQLYLIIIINYKYIRMQRKALLKFLFLQRVVSAKSNKSIYVPSIRLSKREVINCLPPRLPSPLYEKSECKKAKRHFSNTCRSLISLYKKRKKKTDSFLVFSLQGISFLILQKFIVARDYLRVNF